PAVRPGRAGELRLDRGAPQPRRHHRHRHPRRRRPRPRPQALPDRRRARRRRDRGHRPARQHRREGGRSLMRRTFEDARDWSAAGTRLFLGTVAGWGEEEYLAPSGLPGWTRKHLIAHVAANADALGNLVRWAATGEPTPMYVSREQRNADIEAGASKPAAQLAPWPRPSAD